MGRGGEELYLRLLQRLFPPDVGFQFLIGFPEIRQRRPQVLGQSVQAFPQCPELGPSAARPPAMSNPGGTSAPIRG